MKCTLAVLAVSLAITGVQAQPAGRQTKGMQMDNAASAQTQTRHKGSGTVQKVDPAKGTVTIAHGPVPSLKWPAMTMTFDVQDRTALANVHPGAVVQFEFVQQASHYTITSIR